MGNKEQGRASTGGDFVEERVGGRGHVLPEELEPHNTYRRGRHKTELHLLVVRQHQLRRVKDCKALAGEYVTTRYKPVVFEVRLKKWKERGQWDQSILSGGSTMMR